jgi:hypothetical protein
MAKRKSRAKSKPEQISIDDAQRCTELLVDEVAAKIAEGLDDEELKKTLWYLVVQSIALNKRILSTLGGK